MRCIVLLLLTIVQMSTATGAVGQATAERLVMSGWLGLGFDDDGAFPIAPQLAVRMEVAAAPAVWIGGEISTVFIAEEQACAASGGCGAGFIPLPSPSASLLARVEVGRQLRPYITGVYGRSFTTRGSTTEPLWGLGVGLRATRRGTWDQFFVEGRYRRVERTGTVFDDNHRVELIVGLGR